MKDPSAEVRYQAVREVAGRKDLDCTLPLSLLLGDAEQRVRMEAARALGEEASKQGIEALVASLSTPDREFREILSDLLAPLGVETIKELIGHPDDVHRRLALAWTLGKTGDPAALPELQNLARDGEAQVRAAAAGALGKIDVKKTAGILVELMVDPDSRVRAAAVNGIGQLGKLEMLPLLLERTDEPSTFVLGRLAVALGLLGIKAEPDEPGGSSVIGALKKIAKRLQGSDRQALVYIGFGLSGFREGVNLCLDALADPEMEPKVWKALQGEPGLTRERFRRTLDLGGEGRTGELQAGRLRERYIHQLQNSRDDDLRVAAILSLRAVGVGEGVDALLKAIASDPAPDVRRTALECIAPDYRDDRVGGALRRALRDLHLAKRTDHDVARFEIAVHDAATVRVGNGLADTRKHIEQPRQVAVARLSIRQQGGESGAAYQLHREIRALVRVQAQLVHWHNSGMLQLSANLCLFDKAAHHRRSVGVVLVQDLDRDISTQVRIVGAQDNADAAARDLLEDLQPTKTALKQRDARRRHRRAAESLAQPAAPAVLVDQRSAGWLRVGRWFHRSISIRRHSRASGVFAAKITREAPADSGTRVRSRRRNRCDETELPLATPP